MKRLTIFAVVIAFQLPVACSGQAPPGQGKVVVTPAAAPEKAREEVRDLLLDLREAKTLAGVVSDRAIREKLKLALARIERRAENLDRLLAAVGPSPAAWVAMSADDFARVLKAAKAESFDAQKLALLKDVIRQSYFTCAQATELVKIMSFGEGRTNIAIAIHPLLVDPANFFQVLGAMSFNQEKDTVRKALKLNQ